MKKVAIDKICSVTKNLGLKHIETILDKPKMQLPCTMGTVLAAEVLDDKSIYNEIELPSGRMSKIKKGDIIAVASSTSSRNTSISLTHHSELPAVYQKRVSRFFCFSFY